MLWAQTSERSERCEEPGDSDILDFSIAKVRLLDTHTVCREVGMLERGVLRRGKSVQVLDGSEETIIVRRR